MKIIKEQTKYYNYAFIFDFRMPIVEFCRSLKNKYGWQNFCFSEKKWRFNNFCIMHDIKQKYPQAVLDTNTLIDWEKFELEEKTNQLKIKKGEQIKKAVKSDLTVRGLKGNPYPYQLLGVEFFINNNGRAILADQPGVGKSLQVLAYVVHQKLKRILIVCPASVKFSWESEVRKWTNLKSFVISSKINITIDDLNNYNIFIINYELLQKFFSLLSVTQWDCVIFDESHYLKSPKARRYKLSKKLATNISKVLLLSGTPILNRPHELWTSLNILNEREWINWFQFTQKFCGGHFGHFGYEYNGATNIEELKSKIAPYFLRRTKAEVLPDLPPKIFINLPIELKKEDWDKYLMAEKRFVEYLKEIKQKKDEDIKKSLQAEKLVRLGELRQISSMGKIDAAIETIESIISNNEKILVFSTYNEPLKYLYNYFQNKAVLLIGETKLEERGININKFQTDENCLIFFAGMHSGGIGITLTAAKVVLLIDFDFVPAIMEQAVDRVHRPGQIADKVIIYQLIGRNTIDDKMINILEEKRKIFDQLINNEKIVINKHESLVNDLIKMYEKNSS